MVGGGRAMASAQQGVASSHSHLFREPGLRRFASIGEGQQLKVRTGLARGLDCPPDGGAGSCQPRPEAARARPTRDRWGVDSKCVHAKGPFNGKPFGDG